MAESSLRVVTTEREGATPLASPFDGSNPRETVVRTGGGISRVDEMIPDETVEGDGNVRDKRKVHRGAGYSVEASLRFAANDSQIEEAFRSTFAGSEVTLTDTDIEAVASGNQLISATADKFNAFTPLVGMMVEISGFSNSQNNGFARIASVTEGGSPVLALDPDHITIVDEAAGQSVTLDGGDWIKNGTDVLYANFEEDLTDIGTGSFWQVASALCTSFSLQHGENDIVGVTFGYDALDYNVRATSTGGNGVVTDPPGKNNSAIDAANGLAALLIADQTLAGQNVISLDFNAALSGRPRGSAGSINRQSIGTGDWDLNGAVGLYLEDAIEAALTVLSHSGTKTGFAAKYVDSAGNAYWFNAPSALLGQGGPEPGGKNAFITSSYTLSFDKDSTLDATMSCQKIAA